MSGILALGCRGDGEAAKNWRTGAARKVPVFCDAVGRKSSLGHHWLTEHGKAGPVDDGKAGPERATTPYSDPLVHLGGTGQTDAQQMPRPMCM